MHYNDRYLNTSYDINESHGDHCVKFHGIAEADESFVSDYGFNLYGRYPENYGEIIISDYMFEGFKVYGYKPNDGPLQAISSYNDILNSANDEMAQYGLQSAMFTAKGFYRNFLYQKIKKLLAIKIATIALKLYGV